MARSKPENKIESKKKAPAAVKPVKVEAPAMMVEPQASPEVQSVKAEPEMKVEEQQIISLDGITKKSDSEPVTEAELKFVDSLIKGKQEDLVKLKNLYNGLSRRFHSNYRVPSLEECLKQSHSIAPSQAELIAQERRSMVKRNMF